MEMRGSHFRLGIWSALVGSALLAVGALTGRHALAVDPEPAMPSCDGAQIQAGQSTTHYGWRDEYGVADAAKSVEGLSSRDHGDNAAANQTTVAGPADPYLYRYEYPEDDAQADSAAASAGEDAEVRSMEEYYQRYGYRDACPEPKYASDEAPAPQQPPADPAPQAPVVIDPAGDYDTYDYKPYEYPHHHYEYSEFDEGQYYTHDESDVAHDDVPAADAANAAANAANAAANAANAAAKADAAPAQSEPEQATSQTWSYDYRQWEDAYDIGYDEDGVQDEMTEDSDSADEDADSADEDADSTDEMAAAEPADEDANSADEDADSANDGVDSADEMEADEPAEDTKNAEAADDTKAEKKTDEAAQPEQPNTTGGPQFPSDGAAADKWMYYQKYGQWDYGHGPYGYQYNPNPPAAGDVQPAAPPQADQAKSADTVAEPAKPVEQDVTSLYEGSYEEYRYDTIEQPAQSYADDPSADPCGGYPDPCPTPSKAPAQQYSEGSYEAPYGDFYGPNGETVPGTTQASPEETGQETNSAKPAGDNSCYDDTSPYQCDQYGFPKSGYGYGYDEMWSQPQQSEQTPVAEQTPAESRQPDAADVDDPSDYESAWEGEPGETTDYRHPSTRETYEYEYWYPENAYGYDYGLQKQAPPAIELPPQQAQPVADPSPAAVDIGLELFAWLPGELLIPPDQDLLRSLERMSEDSPDARRTALNDYLKNIGSEAVEFAQRFESASGIELDGMADNLPGTAAFLGCYRLIEQGEVGMDEAADLLKRSLPTLSQEWIDGVYEITADAYERNANANANANVQTPQGDVQHDDAEAYGYGSKAYEYDANVPAYNSETYLYDREAYRCHREAYLYRSAEVAPPVADARVEGPILRAMLSVAVRSLGDFGGAMGMVSRKAASVDWHTLMEAGTWSRAASRLGQAGDWLE